MFVLLGAVTGGRGAGVVSALVAAISFDFFHTRPYGSLKITDGNVPVGRLDGRAFTPDELRDGWRLACRAAANEDLMIDVPPLQTRPKAALVGVGG